MEEKKNAAPLVVKLSGKALGAEKELERLCRELEAAGRAFLLVHGGGVAVDRLMADLGIEARAGASRESCGGDAPHCRVARRHLQSGAPVRRRAGGPLAPGARRHGRRNVHRPSGGSGTRARGEDGSGK